MANLRLVSDNPADRATITPSSQTGTLVATNLQNDRKSSAWRASGTTATLALTVPSAELAACCHLAYSNLSPTATMRVQLSNEAAATNLVLQSSGFSNAAYTKTGVTVSTSVTSPDGTANAPTILETAVTSNHLLQQSVSVSSGITYAYSIFVKANGRTRVQLQNTTLGAFANFNLSTAAVLTTGGAGYVSSSITAYPNSWYRLALVFTASATSAQLMTLFLQDAAGASSYLGVVTNGVCTWGWQLETGSAATSYYPTTTAAATRPAGFIDNWQTYALDVSGSCCPAPARVPRGWTAAAAASAHAYGGGAHADLWFTQTSWRGAIITITDTNNLQGYIEAGRLILAPYWSPTVGADYGASVTPIDNSKEYDLENGDTFTEAGTRKRKIDLPLSNLSAAERASLFSIAMSAGTVYPVLVSLYPESSDPALERDHTIYGRFVSLAAVTSPSFSTYATSLQIKEI